jgi:hypothetical protein
LQLLLQIYTGSDITMNDNMYTFLGMYNLQRLNHKEIGNQNKGRKLEANILNDFYKEKNSNKSNSVAH